MDLFKTMGDILRPETHNIMERTEKIAYIKRIISEYGPATTKELEVDAPCVFSVGKEQHTLAETFEMDGVITTTYVNGDIIDLDKTAYENLGDDVIDQIVPLIEDYEANLLNAKQ